jgi:lysophosphatidylcholine acyltransferase/lyso-PAF acetyltransferase
MPTHAFHSILLVFIYFVFDCYQTTTVGNALIQFKPGAFLPGVPVQPCLVRYHNARFHPSWVSGGSKAPILLLRLLCEPINFMSCEFLPPYTPSAAEKSDAILFARNVRSLMAARLGVPVTEHSFEDIVLQQEALAAHQSPEFMQIELEKIKSALHCDVATIKKQLLKFKAMDKNGDGMLDVLEFERGLGFTEPSDVLRNLFSQLDVYETGRIDFREFLLGLGVLSSSSPQDTDAVVELAFKMFDLEGTGRVRVDVLHRAFRRMIPDASSDEEHQAFAELEAKDTGSGVDLSAFKEFVLRDSRYLALFKQTIASVSEDSTTKVSKSK